LQGFREEQQENISQIKPVYWINYGG